MKARSTKKALVLSMLSMLLCITMLAGTTFAWFTDSVSSANNIIVAGNLDVELKYAKIKGDKLTAWDTVGGKDNVFDKKALWEPGRVEVVYLEVANLGSLALKYQLSVNVADEKAGKNVAGEDFKLSDHLVFKVVELDAIPTTPYTREEAIKAAGTVKGLKDYNGETTPLEVKGTDYVALIVYMPESVGNEANYRGTAIPQIELGINLVATQLAAEEDSFGPDYDKDAWDTRMSVYEAADLEAAVANAKPGTVIELANDITLTESLVIPAPETAAFAARAAFNGIVLDLNGKTITCAVARDADGNRVHAIVNKGNAVIENGTITSAAVNGGSAILNTGVLTLEDMTVNGAPSDTATGTASYAVNTEGADAKLTVINSNVSGRGAIGATKGTKVVINGGTFHTPAVAWGHAVYANGEGTEIVINGGIFSEGYEMAADNWGMYQIYAGSKAKVTVNGGSFLAWDCANGYDLCTGGEGVIEIFGGTFADNPASQNKINYVADGYKAVEIDGKYIVASENAVANTDELVAAINAKQAEIILLPGDYALRFTNNTAFNLNDTTIKGMDGAKLSISSSEGWYGRMRASNVTFENVHFVSAVGATGKATYTNCTFDSWAICAAGNEKTYFNNCTINGCLNTSTDFSSDDVFVKDCEIAETEYSGSMTMNFENCKIGKLISWNVNTNLTNCDVTTMDLSKVTTAVIRIDGKNVVANTDALVAAINAKQAEIILFPGDYALRFTNNTAFNLNDTIIKGMDGAKLSISSSEGWYGRIRASNVTFENVHFVSAVGATGKATYTNCTFDSWAICAAGNEKTYFNNCTINGCLNTSTDFSSDDVFVKDCEIAETEYSGSMTMNFENCTIGKLISWNVNTNLTNCDVTTMDLSKVTTAVIRIDGIDR